MTCIIEQQITAHVDEPEPIECLTGCGGELIEQLFTSDESLLECKKCGAAHFLDIDGLVLNER